MWKSESETTHHMSKVSGHHVAKGLQSGDVVVAIGAHLLTDGQRVRVPTGAQNVK